MQLSRAKPGNPASISYNNVLGFAFGSTVLVTPDSTGHPQQTRICCEDMTFVVHNIIFKQTLQTIGLHIICNSIYTFLQRHFYHTHIYGSLM